MIILVIFVYLLMGGFVARFMEWKDDDSVVAMILWPVIVVMLTMAGGVLVIGKLVMLIVNYVIDSAIGPVFEAIGEQISEWLNWDKEE